MSEPVAVGQVRRRPLFGGMVADHEVAAVRGDLVALYPTLDASATWEYADIVASWPLVLPLPEPVERDMWSNGVSWWPHRCEFGKRYRVRITPLEALE